MSRPGPRLYVGVGYLTILSTISRFNKASHVVVVVSCKLLVISCSFDERAIFLQIKRVPHLNSINKYGWRGNMVPQ